MNKQEFTEKIKIDFPSLPLNFFEKFSVFCNCFREQEYSRIYHQFNRTKIYGGLPKIQDFYQAARDLGINEIINPGLKYSAFKCNECGTLFEGEGHCPFCKQWTAITVLMSENPIPSVVKGVTIGTPVSGDVFLETFEKLVKAKSLKNKGGINDK